MGCWLVAGPRAQVPLLVSTLHSRLPRSLAWGGGSAISAARGLAKQLPMGLAGRQLQVAALAGAGAAAPAGEVFEGLAGFEDRWGSF